MLVKKLSRKLYLNSSRQYLDDFARDAGRSVPAGATVLDAGAGTCLYKRHFSHTVYESADFCQLDKAYGEITYVCDLANIPVEDERYDLVFCSQVLEHIPEPTLVLSELYRVLKPGGSLWLSAPLFYEEHDVPYDFYRYTQYGFKHLLGKAGFNEIRTNWLEGYFGTLSYQLVTAYRALPIYPRDYGSGLVGWASAAAALSLKPFFALLSLWLARMDLRNRYTDAGQCKNYAVVATKRAKIV